jgi:hypothetical protein
MQLYSEILDAGGPAFGAILRHVRDSPNDAFIFHCTGAFSAPRDSLLLKVHPAGKDRTGIAAALLLLVRPSLLPSPSAAEQISTSSPAPRPTQFQPIMR